MKLKTKFLIIAFSIISIIFLVNILLGWVPVFWSTTIYSSTYENRVPVWDRNYEILRFYQEADYWNDIFIEARTSSSKDTLHKTYFPTSICFNFVTNQFHEDDEFTINKIEILDINNKKLNLFLKEKLPANLKFNKTGNLYVAGLKSQERYTFTGTINEVYEINIEMQNNKTNEIRKFSLVLEPNIECHFGYWRN